MAVGVAEVPGTVTVGQVTVPLLDVVDGPTPTAHRAAHPGARGDATLIVRVIGYAIATKAPQVAAAGGAPRAYAGVQAEAAAVTAVGAPVASLPARPVPLEVAPVAARKDTPAAVAPGVPVLLGRARRPSRASGRAPRVHVEAATRVGSRSVDGPAPTIGPVDLGPTPAPGVAQAEPTRAQADRAARAPLQVTVERPVPVTVAPASVPGPVGATEAVRSAARAVVEPATTVGVAPEEAAKTAEEGQAATKRPRRAAAAIPATGRAAEVSAASSVAPSLPSAAMKHGLAMGGEARDRIRFTVL